MKIYNSLTDKKEEFVPVREGKLSMYVCGPTVYNYIHIGNARPVIFFDVVARYFEYRGYEVTYVSNVTDVDDKIIKKAMEERVSESTIAKKYIDAFFLDSSAAGCNKPNVTPYATEYIEQMIEFIKHLEDLGYAYNVDGDVYFRVTKVKNYGVLSNQNTSELEANIRKAIDSEKKESPLDFTLWKKTSEGIKWASPWGEGRPGWHTECVVMIDSIFGGKIDIHGGGVDLKFPHHENEIAQSEALHNHEIANTFMHVGRISLNDEKMSKSLGNVMWFRDLIKEHKPNAYRMLLLSSPYRQPVNYTNELMSQFDRDYEKIERAYKQAFLQLDLQDGFEEGFDEESLDLFEQYMDDDFNTPNVFMIINELVKKINVEMRKKASFDSYFNSLKVILTTLGLTISTTRLSEEDKKLYLEWNLARNKKDFSKADELRSLLSAKGIV